METVARMTTRARSNTLFFDPFSFITLARDIGIVNPGAMPHL